MTHFVTHLTEPSGFASLKISCVAKRLACLGAPFTPARQARCRWFNSNVAHHQNPCKSSYFALRENGPRNGVTHKMTHCARMEA